MAQGYRLEFERAWIYWQPWIPDSLEIGFRDVDQTFKSHIFTPDFEGDIPVRHRPADPFSAIFTRQWENFIGALRGTTALKVTGRDASQSIAFIADCYAKREFFVPPWFTVSELETGLALNRGGGALKLAILGAGGFLGSRAVNIFTWGVKPRYVPS